LIDGEMKTGLGVHGLCLSLRLLPAVYTWTESAS